MSKEALLKAATRPVALTGGNTIDMAPPLWPQTVAHELFIFNERLSSVSAQPVNESDIIGLMAKLEELPGRFTAAHGLTLARIAELALFCAGNYADGCEIEAAGDLLVTPRQVDIHVRGEAYPVLKKRHGRISAQLAGFIGNENPVGWLKHNTWPIIRKQALLPDLYEALTASGLLACKYLQSIEARMCQIADTVTFLSAWQIGNIIDLHKKLEISSPETRDFVASNLCRFDLTVFHDIGKDIGRIRRGASRCQYLRKDAFKNTGDCFFSPAAMPVFA